MAEEDTDWSYSYSPVPTLSSGLEKGGYDGPVGGEHTTLLSHPGGIRGGDGTIVSSPLLRSTRIDPELQARLEGMDTRSIISTERRQLNGGLRYSTRERSYQDSGFSEDTDLQMNPVATTYLGKTKSGTIYIEPSDDAKIPLSHYSQPLMPGSQSDSSTNDRTLSQRLRSPGDTTSTPPSSTAGGMVVGGGGMGTMYHHHVYPTLGGSSSGKTGSTSCGKNYGVGYHGGNGGTAGAGCSWRSLAVVFIVLTLAMAATSVFLVVSSRLSTHSSGLNGGGETAESTAKVCPVVDSQSSMQKITGDSSLGGRGVPDPPVNSLSSSHRSLPPDGASFREVKLKDKMAVLVPPFGYLNLQFFLQESSHVAYDVWIPRGSSFAVYARRNALPTHTKYNHILLISGYRESGTTVEPSPRPVRSIGTVHKTEDVYMEGGHWFISVYNDDGEAQPLEVMLTDHGSNSCGGENGGVCNGNGECVDGQCVCSPGFDGQFCTQSVCPVLCSGRGEYKNGECKCQPGWKGKECHIRYEECEMPDCSGHGVCEDGVCVCIKGYKGEFCQEGDCVDPDCSGHGICVSGECICRSGWTGTDCGQADLAPAGSCQPECSRHGAFSLEAQGCVCEPGWTGTLCEVRECSIDCGPHGACENMACTCQQGWTGDLCQYQECDPRCSYHGQCKNGTCLCVRGWNGKHCTLEGCVNQCSGNGRCETDHIGNYYCDCDAGWDGKDCGTMLETDCSDGIDNDKDGLLDCQDPECCDSSACARNQLCYTVPKPINILLQRQPPAQTASFFQKMRFMIEDGSLQRSTSANNFNESRAAVIRGQVVTEAGRGLVGVRIAREGPTREGFTMTREDGWFDILVNGGGSVTLQFGKSPFPPISQTVYAPWNQIVVLDPVTMRMSRNKDKSGSAQNHENAALSVSSACLYHDHVTIQPIVIASRQFPSSVVTSSAGGRGEENGGETAVVAESQAVYEVLQIPATAVKLVHSSPRSKGFFSTVQLQLTPEKIPNELTKVYLKITIEGEMFEKTFEAEPNLKHTYSWRGVNYYRQRVYGATQVLVRVGYEYLGCPGIIWSTRSSQVSGLDLPVSNIGGWDLDIHHRYNFQDGIMYRGDGTNVFLKDAPSLVFTTLGDGKRRAYVCPHCDGFASHQRLLAASDIVAAPDGSLYVADFNLIRRVFPDSRVRTLLQLNATSVALKYHLAVNPKTGDLYVSDPQGYRILQVLNTEDPSNPITNWATIIGGQGQCLPGNELRCGDDHLGQRAHLIQPKGLAVTAEGHIVFVDGTTIRKVDGLTGIITTLVSQHLQERELKNIPCSGTYDLKDVTLGWPTKLAINPLDNTVHFIDGNVILKITNDNFLKVSAGRPLHCGRPESAYYNNYAAYTTLVSPQAIAFSANGEMYVAESDSKRINRISMVGTDGRISVFAGRDSKCNCQEASCDCTSSTNHLAVQTLFRYISGVACSPDGKVHVSDQANYMIRTIQKQIPGMDSNGNYQVYSPAHQETYIFNKFGLHMETMNMATRETVYKFAYSVSTSSGVLVSVTDYAGGKLSILRNYAGQVEAIKNPQGDKFTLTVDRKHLLRSFAYDTDNKNSVQFEYDRSKELLRSRTDPDGNSRVYAYDRNGRLERVILPTGEVIVLTSDISIDGAIVNITRKEHKVSLLIQKSFVQKTSGNGETVVEVIQKESDKGYNVQTSGGHRIVLHTSPYVLLEQSRGQQNLEAGSNTAPGLAESFPVASSQHLLTGKESLNRLSWEYYSSEPDVPSQYAKVGKRLIVNGQPIYTVDMLTAVGQQFISADIASKRSVNITSVPGTKYISLSGANSGFVTIEERSNPIGLLQSWRMGPMERSYDYDHTGRLKEVRDSGTKGSLQYIYPDSMNSGSNRLKNGGKTAELSRQPVEIIQPNGNKFSITYDSTGALEAVTTPLGGVHRFQRQVLLGSSVIHYLPPWCKQPHALQYDQNGLLTAKILPENHGKIIYTYDGAGLLKAIIGGDTAVHYHYVGGTALVRSVELTDEKFHLKSHYRYTRGALKELNVHFLSGYGLSNYSLAYQTDAMGRMAGVQLDVPGQAESKLQLQYDIHNGKIKRVADIQVTQRSPTMITLEDTTKNFVRQTKSDEFGRLQSFGLIISGVPVFSVEVDYNSGSLIQSRTIYITHEKIKQEYTYTANNEIATVKTADATRYVYAYDANGNTITINEDQQRVNLGYDDSADRVTQFGGVEFATYDTRGFVIRRGEQRYSYNALGQMVKAFEPNKFAVRFFYDDSNRLIGTKDHKQNIVQYIYSLPSHPHRVTHVYEPYKGQVTQLIYDEMGLLIAMENQGNRFYIGTDTQGSPLAVFKANGQLLKQVDRTPYGRTTHDSNPTLRLFIDFNGGLINEHTRLIHFGDRVFDPLLCQWMTPAWDQLFTVSNDVTTRGQLIDQLFLYRYNRNNPINGAKRFIDKMQEPNGWMTLLDNSEGLQRQFNFLEDLSGSTYITAGLLNPTAIHNVHIAAGLSGASASGLQVRLATEQSYRTVQNNLLSPTFVQEHVKLVKQQQKSAVVNLMERGISCRPSVFGSGLLVASAGGNKENSGNYDDIEVTQVNAEASQGNGNSASSVFTNVFASVLQGAKLLDINGGAAGGHRLAAVSDPTDEQYMFVKSENRFRHDLDELNRLLGSYNVTNLPLRGGGTQICTEKHRLGGNNNRLIAENKYDLSICILYGANLDRVIRHKIRQGTRSAIRAAWKQEIRRVSLGFPGDWTPNERDELMRTGEVKGYSGEEIHSVHKYPSLLGQASNIRLVRDRLGGSANNDDNDHYHR